MSSRTAGRQKENEIGHPTGGDNIPAGGERGALALMTWERDGGLWASRMNGAGLGEAQFGGR